MRPLLVNGSIMDLKQKFEDAKSKLKKHAPVIAVVSSAIAAAATTAVVIMYNDQKKNLEALQNADAWITGHREHGICMLSEEDQDALKEGGAMIFNYGSSDDNYCLMYCNETHTDGKHGN